MNQEMERFLYALFEQHTKNTENIQDKEYRLRQKKEKMALQTNFFLKERIKEEACAYSNKKS